MDTDEFERLRAGLEAKWGPERFAKFKEAFNAEMRKNGKDQTFEDYMRAPSSLGGEPEANPARAQLEEMVMELRESTTDDGPQEIILRGLAVYRSIVRHAKAGGTVKFVAADGTEKTLKVRLKGT